MSEIRDYTIVDDKSVSEAENKPQELALPKGYISVTGVNRAMKRALQKERSKRRKTVYACNICKLAFTGVNRCQCKPFKAPALEVA